MIIKKIELANLDIYEFKNMSVTVDKQVKINCDYHKVLGLGERYNAINQKGNVVVNMVEEKFCNQGEKTYFPLPFFILDNGYAFYINTSEVINFSFKDTIKINFDEPSEADMYILKGEYKEVIKDFIKLTGNMKKAPKWIFGPWISAHRWNSQELVNQVRHKLKSLDIPVTVMVLEQWSDEATFYIFNKAKYLNKEVLGYEDYDFAESPWPNPKAMIQDLHEDGIRLLLWQCPVVKYIPPNEPNNDRHNGEWDYVKKNNMVITSKDDVYTIPEGNWFNGSMIPDFTNRDTVNWWFNNRKYLLDIGVDGFKTDGGEFIHCEAYNAIGESMKQLKNNYSLEYVKAYDEFLGDERVAFSRAGYIGQQTYSLQWAGDQKSTFDELNSIYNAGINASICGQINWGFDIAGFSGELPSIELFYRAHQFAAFVPIMQIHSEPVGGQFSINDPIRIFNNERTPWNVADGDEQILQEIRKLYILRMNLIPYIYCEYLKAIEKNTTLMKHMNIDYSGDFHREQYIFGETIVAPVLEENCGKKDIILPDGVYYNIFTNKKYVGKAVFENVELDDMFTFVREGTALVTKETKLIPDKISNEISFSKICFRLFGEKGKYRFVDENNDFNIQWAQGQVNVIGSQSVEISWIIIQ
jgi:alpha-D-xyloside xylohydrolase